MQSAFFAQTFPLPPDVLHLARRNVFARAFHHVLNATDDKIVAVLVLVEDVACAEPLSPEHVPVCDRTPVVTPKDASTRNP